MADDLDARVIGLLIASGEFDFIDKLPNNYRLESGLTVQHIAAICANYALAKNALKKLVEKGASLDCSDAHGRTPLHSLFSISREHLDRELGHLGLTEQYLNIRSGFSRLLISYGAKVSVADKKGNLPIHYAAANGYYDGVKIMLKQGVGANSVNVSGINALDFAVFKGRDDIVSLLRASGGKKNNSDAHVLSTETVNLTNPKGEAVLTFIRDYVLGRKR